VSWSGIAWMLDLGELVIAGTAAAVRTKVTRRPWSSVIIRQVDTTVVPWIAVSIEASCGLDGDEGGFRNVAGAILEE